MEFRRGLFRSLPDRTLGWDAPRFNYNLMDSIALRPRGAPGFEREGGVVLVSGLIRMPKGVPPMTTTVKLSKLTLSPINVRRRPDDLLEIPQMAADLEARGALQYPLVTPVKDRKSTRLNSSHY